MSHNTSLYKTFIFTLVFLTTQVATGKAQDSKIDLNSINAQLAELFNKQMESPTKKRSQSILSLWETACHSNYSFEYDFSSIPYCKVLDSDDKKLKIITWADPLNHPEPKYYGFVLFRESKNKDHITWPLLQGEKKFNESSILSHDEWYGSIYYKLIEEKRKRKTIYTLLGWSPLKRFLNQKFIEVITIEEDKCILGKPIFETPEGVKSRVHFAYSKQTAMTLNSEGDEIHFDHLSPSIPEMKGIYQFYGPDMTFDTYVWKKGVWTLLENTK